MTTNEKLKQTTSWWKRLNRKLEGKPQPMQILQKRTMNTALAVLENLEDIPFTKLSMSLYFYCQDLRMTEFTKQYENQIELAGANPEKFVFQLHKFFNDMTNKIKKDNLYEEFFEFYYRCVRLRAEQENQNINDDVVVAYLNLLTQNIEYLRPSKFDFTTAVAGRKTTGEIITTPDLFPNIDLAGYDFEADFEQGKIKGDPITAISHYYKKYGYDVKSMEDLHLYTNVDKLQTTTTTALLAFINEFTFDILPKEPFTTRAAPFELLSTNLSLDNLKNDLSKRNKTLPSNGVIITFKDNPLFKTLLLKEIFFDNSIFMLYRVSTVEGDLSGYYDTKGQFFFTMFREYRENPHLALNFSALILYLYGCYALNKPEYQLTKVSDFFTFKGHPQMVVEGVLHGGKVKNVYDPDKEITPGTARKGNADYEQETKSIQGFIRRLPIGQQASERAIALAESLGYDLAPNETYVQPFIKQVFKLKRKETF